MGNGRHGHKHKRGKQDTNAHRVNQRNGVARRQHSQHPTRALTSNNISTKNQTKSTRPVPVPVSGSGSGTNAQHQTQVQPSGKVPFAKHDNVLLIGEGDFSFTLSLATYHQVGRITATSFDSRSVLEEKYPGIAARLNRLLVSTNGSRTPENGRDRNGIRGDEVGDEDVEEEVEEAAWNGFSPTPPSSSDLNDTVKFQRDMSAEKEQDGDALASIADDGGGTKPIHVPTSIHHDIDATKLVTKHGKLLRSTGPYSKIVFNFPHVGGLSTDVNRQVRSNQQLLVGFFDAAKSLLSTPGNPVKRHILGTAVSSRARDETQDAEGDGDDGKDEEDEYDEDGSDDETAPSQNTTGCILVTLFEGEPYTLWNIRDLARHTGLKVIESFKFPWGAYPGYQHARTIGEITTGKDRTSQSQRKGAWRGEERDARCYILTLNDAEGPYPGAGQGKKRKKREDDDEDSG